MEKRLILGVSCVNEFGSDVPDHFTIVIDDALATRIKQLHETVKTLGVNAIEEFCFEGYWGSALSVDDDDDGYAEHIAAIEGADDRIDMEMLRVTEDGFCFTAVPKHCGDDMALRTVPYVAISDLDNDQIFVALEG
jgi:hypothetical protein